MHAEVINIEITAMPPQVAISHAGESVWFSLERYSRQVLRNRPRLYESINRYWASLPEEQQAAIFELFRSSSDVFLNAVNRHSLRQVLALKLEELIALHPFPVLHEWVTWQSNIPIPSDSFQSEYLEDSDKAYTREKTYLRAEYVDLVVLALVLRVALPLLSEYLAFIRHDVDPELSDLHAVTLLRQTWIASSAPFEKMEEYIDEHLGTLKDTAPLVAKGISIEDFPELVFAEALMGRVAIGEINSVTDKTHLVKSLYGFVNATKSPRYAPDAEHGFREKTATGSGENGSNERGSAMEMQRNKYRQSFGEEAELEVMLKHPWRVAELIIPNLEDTIWQARLTEALETVQVLSRECWERPQIGLMQWMLHRRVISGRGVSSVGKMLLIEIMAVVQTALWADGHPYLAVLATSYKERSGRYTTLDRSQAVLKVPENVREHLNYLFPLSRTLNGKKSQSRPLNQAEAGIELMTSDFLEHEWVPTASSELLQEVFGADEVRHFSAKHDTLTYVTQLALQVGALT